MFTHILIPTDGSPLSAAAVEKGLTFARDIGAKVTVLTVVEPFHVLAASSAQLEYTREAYEREVAAQAAAYLADADRRAKALGVTCETMQAQHDEPYQAIIDAATERGCDLVAMASHGRRGFAAIVLGSQTTKVLTHSKLPVLVYR